MNMKKKNKKKLQLSQYWYAQYKHVKPTHHDFYTNQVLSSQNRY